MFYNCALLHMNSKFYSKRKNVSEEHRRSFTDVITRHNHSIINKLPPNQETYKLANHPAII